MAGPWEKYADTQPDQGAEIPAGPWSKYAAQDPGSSDAPSSLADYGKAALGAVQSGMAKVDSYTGAPVRSAIYAAETSPTEMGRPGAAYNAFVGQFGQDPSNAPTSKQIAVAGGISPNSIIPQKYQQMASGIMKGNPIGFMADKLMPGSVENAASVSPAGLASVPIDVVTNPLTYIPVGELASTATKGLARGADAAADSLESFAAKKAVAATGATGKQALKFAPNAGQELLDQGIVKFGDSQAKVAQKASDALEASGKKIGDVLTALDKKGATVDHADIVASLRNRASELSNDPAQFGVSDSLNKLADRIEQMVEAKGNSKVPLTQAEITKRGFQQATNYNSSPLDLSTSQEAAKIYRQAVEDAATKMDPEAARAFIEDKKINGLLRPIAKASEDRASTVAQSPHGGLMDTVATIAGESVGGIPGAVAAPIVRRAVSTRLPSTIAAMANTAGKAVGSVGDALGGSASAMAGGPQAAYGAMVTPASRAPIRIGSPSFIPSAAAAENTPAAANPNVAQSKGANRSPSNGPDAWAQQGLQKLGLSNIVAKKVMQDPKGKQLLIQASDLAPNSKAMKQIMMQIQKGWGQ